MKKNKRIKISKLHSVSERELHKVAQKAGRDHIKPSKENILKQHYKIQVAHPLLRVAIGAAAVIFFVLAFFNVDSLIWLVFYLSGGLILAIVAIRGRRKELKAVVENGGEEIAEVILEGIVEAIGSVVDV